MEEKTGAITDIEYQFVENISAERIRNILTARKITDTEREVKHKEDLIALFNRYLRPLPQRLNQLRREDSKRGTRHMTKLLHGTIAEPDVVKCEEKDEGHDYSPAKIRLAPDIQSKPIKLKRKQSEQEKDGKHKHKNHHDDTGEKKAKHRRDSLRTPDTSSHKDKGSSCRHHSDSSDNEELSHKHKSDGQTSPESVKHKKDRSLDSRKHSLGEESSHKRKLESNKKDHDSHKHKKHTLDSHKREKQHSPTRNTKTDSDNKKEKFSRITWP